MIAFKHIHPDYAEAFLNGLSVQVGLHTVYRIGEGDRVDPDEGMVTSSVPMFSKRGERFTADDTAILDNIGIHIRGHRGPVIIQNYTGRVELPPYYLFCMSSEPDKTRGIKHGERIFKISDIEKFADLLTHADSRLQYGYEMGDVKYTPPQVEPFSAGPSSALPHPLRKSDRFRFENETRIAWRVLGRREDRPNYLQLVAPKIAELLQEVT